LNVNVQTAKEGRGLPENSQAVQIAGCFSKKILAADEFAAAKEKERFARAVKIYLTTSKFLIPSLVAI